MKKIIALSAIVCLIAFSLKSQESIFEKVKPNELSFGFYNVFKLNDSPNFGLLYKRTIKKGAIRVGSKFYLSKSTREYESNDYRTESSSYSISPRVGYEFHSNIKRWQIFYGVDATFSYSNHKSTDNYSNSSIDYRESIDKRYSFGVRPLVGVKYQINPWLSVTTETGVNFNYFASDAYSKVQYIDAESETENIRKTNGFSVYLESLGLLSINFHF